jgi:DNA-nicking Smr family endonuclease
MKRRLTTDEERALFLAVMEGRLTLSRPNIVKIKTDASPRKLTPKRPTGINGATAERMHRGDLAPEARIDLHGMTETVAYKALVTFLTAAMRRGQHLVLVVTGKGVRPVDRFAAFDMELQTSARGVLRAMVPRWLSEPPLIRLIADIRHAHPRHGGEGAYYIYLRKKDG